MLSILNYGSGNIKAFYNIFNRLNIDISIVSSVPDSVVSMVCSIDFTMLNSLVWQDNSLTTVLYALSKHYRPLIERFDVRCFDNACD